MRTRTSGSPDCVVNDRYKNDTTGKLVETALPSCVENPTMKPCWSLVDDAKCAGAKLLSVDRGGAMPPNNLNNDVACALCTGAPGETGCP